MGIRISPEHIERERQSMDRKTFEVERLSVGDWPATDGTAGRVIDPHEWEALIDRRSRIEGRVTLAVDVTPDRSSSTISAAGLRADGEPHVEVIDHRRGVGWVADRLAELKRRHRARFVVLDGVGPAASLLPELKTLKVKVEQVSAKEYAQACGGFYDDVAQRRLRHLGTPELSAAVAGAAKRPLGDAWAWSRRSSAVDISPLVACTLAHWGGRARKGRAGVVNLAAALEDDED
jgi:hypothetical protein